ncbi:methylated-DNA--[protein]-cysteine S-methyltransferase [Chitinophaga nivalis]|uniref:Methylated-DNA--protein-cysteine methyltransferase n=1 Tax=Chitinophaga nivalis TaxID=2991709 RepID=A0ABT3IPF8_9BACT|nr:methylated-DNA--[protein]-cysteine S-methyltransferase [Chitinophaga nivalis]MCW3464452.1 methylated-DNA--[protein]-cysteine S-methyltransferase [Chitinophaga nivalis]MCW3485857.1 methylated-DNA--[protein]-cysteine S-methyltransferase [Chitinophaga nivalis]
METIYHLRIDTPVGPLQISGTATCIGEVTFTEDPPVDVAPPPALLLDCAQQLLEYFKGDRKVFDIPIAQPGTAFQQTVWQQLQTIPYGQTISYQQLAHRIHNPRSIRAVGTTNGKNRLAIIIPCHRVIGSDGTLIGYGGGLWRKRWLLAHERTDLFTGLL